MTGKRLFSQDFDKANAEAAIDLFMQVYNATLQDIHNSAMEPVDKVETIAVLSDSLKKTTSAFKSLLPEQDELAISLKVMDLLLEYL